MPDQASGTALTETHSGIVFFIADRAYKLKKPVNLGFLDFSTRQRREHACHEEIRLNQRFAPDVYLGVSDVHGPDGDICDHLVTMRRMPPDRRLSTLVTTHQPVQGALRDTARILAAWHAQAPRGPQISAQQTRDALRSRWNDSFEQVGSLPGHGVTGSAAAEIERLAAAFLAGRAPLFNARIADGRVVDGHGDLLATDIFCLDDGPRILDCLEFDERLRWLDGLDDASFLAMDLEHLGAPDLAERFIGWYTEFAADPAPPALRHHYIAYRAFVRAKVACLRHAQGDDHAATDARGYTDVALRHLRAGKVDLILVGGLPATGKSSLAGALADRLGCTLLSSDRTRKELAGIPPEAPAAAPYGTGIYTPEWTRRTYQELAERAARLLQLGETVILDASWTDETERDLIASVAHRRHADLMALRCDAPEALAAQRLRQRTHGISDADQHIARAMSAEASPWPEAATIDTSGTVAEALEQALPIIRPHGADLVWPRRPFLSPD